MALTVEDNTGKPDAESYLSVADTSVRLAKLGYSSFPDLATADEAKAEACLRRSTAAVDEVILANPRGWPLKDDQALACPRSGLVIDGRELDGDEVPAVVLNACALGAEVNALALAAQEAPTPEDDPHVKRIRRASTAEVEFFEGGPRLSPERRAIASEMGGLLHRLRFDNPGFIV